MKNIKTYILGLHVLLLPTNIKDIVEKEIVEVIESMEMNEEETKESIENAFSSRLVDLEDLIDFNKIFQYI